MKAIMLMFDSLNRAMLAPYGSKETITPNFTRLAEKSITFDCNYAGSLPCIPARRELHTGRYNFLHRSWGPLEPYDDSAIAILNNNGIYTHLISDHCHYWEDGGATYHTRYNSYEVIRGQEGDAWKVLPESFKPNDLPANKDGEYFYRTGDLQKHDRVNRKFIKTEDEMPLAKTFESAFEFLNYNNNEENWFLQIECFDPHEPFFASERFKEMYEKEYDGKPCDWPAYHTVTEDEKTSTHLKNQYKALLTMCDFYLGKLLDLMDEKDMWNDTLLIVNTDHGYLLGEHGWWSKTVMPVYDEICHTPLFIHDPRYTSEDGTRRNALTQTIDIPVTLLDFFDIKATKDMQGKSLETIIKDKNAKLRDYAMFGFYGSHVNITDGNYVYMKAPINNDSSEIYEYTIMPTHMRSLFSVDCLKKATLSGPFSFTKGCSLLKVPKGVSSDSDNFGDLIINKDPASRNFDNNSLIFCANFGDKLYCLKDDPKQLVELDDPEKEAFYTNQIIKMMQENDSPLEQYDRLGISKDKTITREDVLKNRVAYAKSRTIKILEDYSWSYEAINAYNALLKFLPSKKKERYIDNVKKYLVQIAKDKKISGQMILDSIIATFDDSEKEMIHYFVEMAARMN